METMNRPPIQSCQMTMEIGDPIEESYGSNVRLTYRCNKCGIYFDEIAFFSTNPSRFPDHLKNPTSELNTELRVREQKGMMQCPTYIKLMKG